MLRSRHNLITFIFLFFYKQFHLSSALHCPIHDRVGELVSCLRAKPTPALLAAAEKIGTPLLAYRFAPNVDGIIVKEDFLQNGQIKINMDLLGRYDLLCGLREGPVLPMVGRPPWQSFDLDQFVTAVIKLTLRMEPSSEPTKEVKQVSRIGCLKSILNVGGEFTKGCFGVLEIKVGHF